MKIIAVIALIALVLNIGGDAATHQKNAMTLSRRLAMSQRLWVAQKFAEEETIYFPHELDFRGRIYPVPGGGKARTPSAASSVTWSRPSTPTPATAWARATPCSPSR
jgi:hypothetical protein